MVSFYWPVDCNSGFYGKNCNSKCGLCLKESLTCDHITGACVGGCKPGYKAPNCHTGDHYNALKIVVALTCF